MDSFSILVIEDSFSDADLLSKKFAKAGKKGWTLTRVERLGEGIAMAKAKHFDLALLDLSLPDSDGLETVENFINVVPDVPAIVLTIASDEKLAIAAISKGAQDYLIKGEITPTLNVHVGPPIPPKMRARWVEFGSSSLVAPSGLQPHAAYTTRHGAPKSHFCVE